MLDLFFLGLAPTIMEAAEDPFLLRCFNEPPPHAPQQPPPLMLEQLRSDLADSIAELRLASVEVVERICRWRRRRPRYEAFVWRSHNYLLKMAAWLRVGY